MKEPEGGIVSAVSPESLAERAGIVPGDTIVSIDGHVLRDAVDYQFYAAEPEITAHFRKIDGRDDLVVFEKDPDEDLGLSFGQATWDGVNICNNNCFFCFLNNMLNYRLTSNRKHFFRYCFCCRKKSRSQTSYWNDYFF